MKSVLYTRNTEAQVFESATTPLQLGNIVRRYGKCINSDGTTITIVGSGYYEIDLSADLLGTAAGIGTLSLLQNGVVVAQANETLAAGETSNVSTGAIVRVFCYAPSTNLQVVVDGAGVPTVDNLSVRVTEV